MRRVGYTDCGLVELLTAANLSRGSFYNYFGTKEAFAAEVVAAFYDWHDVRLDALCKETGTPARERLQRYFALLLERANLADDAERGCLLAMLALETSATSAVLRDAVSDSFARWQERIAELLRQAQAEGTVAPETDPVRLGALLLHTWEGALMRARLERDTWPLADFLETALPRLVRP
jgi:TetR/AcrR family transcriptional repressor of nem operon